MSSDFVQKAAEIVEAYVRNNTIPAREIPNLLKEVHSSLMQLNSHQLPPTDGREGAESAGTAATAALESPAVSEKSEKKRNTTAAKPTPAVAVAESVGDDFVICLVCGKHCKTLKGHLTRSHNMDLDSYRKMFDLASDHPVVSPDYSQKRRQLAINAGLGEKLRKARKKKV
uniref:Putative Transcriptional regulator, Ros/MucR family n=1 Tax=Magnetococcus massalia (strain MO-1) TaxID=451514 RepID=A0A1S7LNZ3_MAGMO|nr:putative Transcriptional regulator, Ros/MucR family [Candidatus Magnetococcus massalia]